MIKDLFYSSGKILSLLPLETFVRISGQNVILPFYHIVSDEPAPHILHLYRPKTSKEFEADLDFLLRTYTPIGIDEFMNEEIKKPSMLLSFDDGLREFKDIAAPILLRKGIPCINFINSAFADNKTLFYRFKASLIIDRMEKDKEAEKEAGMTKQEILAISFADRDRLDTIAERIGLDFQQFLRDERPYLSSEEIKTLHAQGFAFGAHSAEHPLYSTITEDEQIEQTKQSIDFIRNLLGIEKSAFSFPFTDSGVGLSFFSKLREQTNVSATFGTAGLKPDSTPNNFQRIPMEHGTFSAKQIIYGEYAYYMAKAVAGKHKITRR